MPDTGEDVVAPSTCGTYDGPLYIGVDPQLCESPSPTPSRVVESGCDSTAWWVSLWTVGSPAAAFLTIHVGSHTLDVELESDPGPGGWYDQPAILGDRSDSDLACGGSEPSFFIVIEDEDGAEADCAAWGPDAEDLAQGCRVISQD